MILSKTAYWYKVKERSGSVLPFKFRSIHPNSFQPSDFGIWAAFYPDQAKLYFSEILVDCFELSWKNLVELCGEKPLSDISDFAKMIDSYPWLKQEFFQWGNIFSSLWINPDQEEEPFIYKLIPKYHESWKISDQWFCKDGFTPRVYKFEELAFQKRFLYISDENDGYLEENSILEIGSPNIGSQYAEDNTALLLLMNHFGFDDDGKLSFKRDSYDQYVIQVLRT